MRCMHFRLASPVWRGSHVNDSRFPSRTRVVYFYLLPHLIAKTVQNLDIHYWTPKLCWWKRLFLHPISTPISRSPLPPTYFSPPRSLSLFSWRRPCTFFNARTAETVEKFVIRIFSQTWERWARKGSDVKANTRKKNPSKM